jgi:hypothetical protein
MIAPLGEKMIAPLGEKMKAMGMHPQSPLWDSSQM